MSAATRVQAVGLIAAKSVAVVMVLSVSAAFGLFGIWFPFFAEGGGI